MKDIEQRRKRIETIAKIAGLLGVTLILGPFYLVILHGLGALLALAVTAVIGITAVNFLPWFSMKLANWKLKALKAEASANPIETLESQYKEREDGLVKFRENIRVFHAEVQNFYSQLEENRGKLAPNALAKFEAEYAKMQALLRSRGEKYKLTQRRLKEFSEQIEQKRVEWNIVQAAAKMTKAAGVGEDFMNKLMTDTALTSIQTNLNTAFAELEVSLLDEQVSVDSSTPQVTTSQPNTTQIAIPEKSGPPVLDLEFDDLPACKNVQVS